VVHFKLDGRAVEKVYLVQILYTAGGYMDYTASGERVCNITQRLKYTNMYAVTSDIT
jgi:hypothetical protein